MSLFGPYSDVMLLSNFSAWQKSAGSVNILYFPGLTTLVCFADGSLSLAVPPDEDRVRYKQRKELHRRRGSLLGQYRNSPYSFHTFVL